jgi:hypothetical protein
MSFDSIGALRAAGVQVDVLNDAQRAVIADLSEQEVATLTSLHRRMEEVGTEVEGHMVAGVGIF